MTKNHSSKVYNDPGIVADYDQRAELHDAERLLFDAYLRQSMSILDIGVGAGRTTPYLSKLAARYVGIDCSEAMIARCREKFPTMSFLQMDAVDMSAFPDCAFDAVVFSFNGIDHIASEDARAKCLRECSRVLRPDGVFILSSHNARYLLFPPILHHVSAVKKAWRLMYSAAQTARNLLPRLSSRAFWGGAGYVYDPLAHGGILTYVSTPNRFAAEMSQLGFKVARVVGAHHPSGHWALATPWYYYACIKTLILNQHLGP